MVTACGSSIASMIFRASRTPKHMPMTSATRTFIGPPPGGLLYPRENFTRVSFVVPGTLRDKVLRQKKGRSGRGPSFGQGTTAGGRPGLGRAESVSHHAFQDHDVLQE